MVGSGKKSADKTHIFQTRHDHHTLCFAAYNFQAYYRVQRVLSSLEGSNLRSLGYEMYMLLYVLKVCHLFYIVLITASDRITTLIIFNMF